MISFGIFLTLCILGADFLIYFLFQWIYGEKRAALAKVVAAQRRAMAENQAGPYLVHSRKGRTVTQERIRKIRVRMGVSRGEKRLA